MLHFALRSMQRSSLQQQQLRHLINCSCSDFWPSTPMQLGFQALSRLLIPQILSFDGFFPSGYVENWECFCWCTHSFSSQWYDLVHQKYDTHTTQKSYPRGVQFYWGQRWIIDRRFCFGSWRPPFFALYYPHYHHIFVYPFFNGMPGRGSVSTVDERRQCSIIVYDDLCHRPVMLYIQRKYFK